jgi:hypothetical protein
MISTFISLAVPSQTVIGFAIAGLLVLLIAAQLLDYEGSPIRSMARVIQAFTSPLLVLFALVVLVRIIRIIA